MTDEVKSIIEDWDLNGDKNRVLNPSAGDEVYLCTEKDKFIRVRILSGQYYGQCGLSNFWEYENLETGEIGHGYGYFFKEVQKDGEC